MKRIVILGLVGLISLPLGAQSAVERRSGIAFGVGGGIGSVGMTCDGCTVDRQTAPGGFARLGGGISRYLTFAGEVNYSRSKVGKETDTFRYMTFTTMVYPSASSGFYLAAHIGMANVSATIPTTPIGNFGAGEFKFESSGIAFGGGLGFDLPISNNIALTPYLSAFGMSGSGSKNRISGSVLQVGVSLTGRGG